MEKLGRWRVDKLPMRHQFMIHKEWIRIAIFLIRKKIETQQKHENLIIVVKFDKLLTFLGRLKCLLVATAVI